MNARSTTILLTAVLLAFLAGGAFAQDKQKKL